MTPRGARRGDGTLFRATLGGLLGLFALACWWAQDHRERRRLAGIHRVLAVFPHPDDETVACGGTLRRLSALQRDVTLLVLTRGERGPSRDRTATALGILRAAEMEAAAQHLGVRRLVQWRFPDGALTENAALMHAQLETLVEELRPDLMLTYGPDGLYGHPDHVACSAVVTSVRRRTHPSPSLWYVALPYALRRTLVQLRTLPRGSASSRLAPAPSSAVFVFPVLASKIRAWRAHQSQSRALGAGPGRLVPGWVIPLLQPFEFFHEVPAP